MSQGCVSHECFAPPIGLYMPGVGCSPCLSIDSALPLLELTAPAPSAENQCQLPLRGQVYCSELLGYQTEWRGGSASGGSAGSGFPRRSPGTAVNGHREHEEWDAASQATVCHITGACCLGPCDLKTAHRVQGPSEVHALRPGSTASARQVTLLRGQQVSPSRSSTGLVRRRIP